MWFCYENRNSNPRLVHLLSPFEVTCRQRLLNHGNERCSTRHVTYFCAISADVQIKISRWDKKDWNPMRATSSLSFPAGVFTTLVHLLPPFQLHRPFRKSSPPINLCVLHPLKSHSFASFPSSTLRERREGKCDGCA